MLHYIILALYTWWGWNHTDIFREWAATYYHAPIYHGHLITMINNRHFLAAAY